MNSFPCWIWRFSNIGRLEFGNTRDPKHWRQLRGRGWSLVNPSVVSTRMQLLATIYQQENLFLEYRSHHARPDLAMEPENFQVIYKGTGDPMFYTPEALADIARAFMLPTSYLLVSRVHTAPRPFDGMSRRRWDRMGTIQPTMSDGAAQVQARRIPKDGASWHMYGRGEDKDVYEIAQQEGTSFHFIHRTPRLYVISYALDADNSGLFTIVESTKKRAEQALLAIHPEAEIESVISSLALPGLAFDQPLT